MTDKIKILLGEAAANYTEAQIDLAYRIAAAEIEEYCNRELDNTLELMAMQIAKIKLNKQGAEGIASQGYSGISESYIDGYPQEIVAVLNRKRKIKIV